jgi:hypothetical protein
MLVGSDLGIKDAQAMLGEGVVGKMMPDRRLRIKR